MPIITCPFEPGDIITNQKTGKCIVINLSILDATDPTKKQCRGYFYDTKTYGYINTQHFSLMQKATPKTKNEANYLQQQAIGWVGGESRYHFGDIIMDPKENMGSVIILDNGHRNIKDNHTYYHIYLVRNKQFDYRWYRKTINNIAQKSNDSTRQQARQLLLTNEFIPSFS